MAYEYTTITIDLTGQGGTGTDGTLYAELFTTVTLANNDTVPPRRYTATVTSGAGSIVLPCTATALKGTNAPFRVSFTPTSGAEVVLGRIVPTESATAVQLSDLLEVGATSAQPVTTYNVDATTLTVAPSIAQLQAMRGISDGLRVLVQDIGIYRYAAASARTADEFNVVTPSSGVGRWIREIGADRPFIHAMEFGATAGGVVDDLPAITAAIAAASAAGGGTVFLSGGFYKISGPIQLASGVNLLGSSMIGTVITTDDTTIAMISGSGDVRLSIENLKLNGPGAGTNIGLSLTAGCADIKIKNVFFDSLNKAVYTNDTYSVSFDTCRILGCAFGYDLTAASNAITMTNCAMLGGVGATGLVFTNSSSLNVIGSAFEGCAPVSIINSDGVKILGNYFENAPPIGGPGTSIAAYVNLGAAGSGTSSPARGVSIAGNLFNVGADLAISVRSVDGLTVEGNTFNTDDYAFEWYQADTSPKKQIHIGSNNYNVGLAGYDQTNLILYTGSTFDSTNCGQTDLHILPQIFPTQLEPQPSTIVNGHGAVWYDGSSLRLKRKNSGGSLLNEVVLTAPSGTDAVKTTGAQSVAGTKTYTDVSVLAGATITASVQLTGTTNLPATTTATPSQVFLTAGWGAGVAGKVYFGDGSGWTFTFATRSGGIDTDRITLYDDGSVTLGGSLAVGGTAARLYSGAGTPEGAVAAAVGSLYTRTDGGAGSTLYVKESGSGNTGWAAK